MLLQEGTRKVTPLDQSVDDRFGFLVLLHRNGNVSIPRKPGLSAYRHREATDESKPCAGATEVANQPP